jgi:hypothetical protein
MALFMDTHTIGGPVNIDDVAKAHAADLQTQGAYNADTAAAVHREAHGLVADEIHPVAEGA